MLRVRDVQCLRNAGDYFRERLVLVRDSDDGARWRDDAQDGLLVVPVDGERVRGTVNVDDTVSDGDAYEGPTLVSIMILCSI